MSLRKRLKRQLRDRQFRHAYADEHLNLSISTQIKVIRESQQLSQAALGGMIGTKQAGISRIESANYSGWSIDTLRRLAEAFDLRLTVSFEEFGTLWKEVDNFKRASLERRSFAEDPEFIDREMNETTHTQNGFGLIQPTRMGVGRATTAQPGNMGTGSDANLPFHMGQLAQGAAMGGDIWNLSQK